MNLGRACFGAAGSVSKKVFAPLFLKSGLFLYTRKYPGLLRRKPLNSRP
jgi:hypothetical protein